MGKKTLGQRLREAREAARKSQQQVADALGVAQPRIAEYEADRREPGAGMLGRLAAAVGSSADELLGLR